MHKNNTYISFLSVIGALVLVACSTTPTLPPLTPIQNIVSLKVLWSHSENKGIQKAGYRLNPILTDHTLYTNDAHGTITAINQQGKLLWKTNTKLSLSSGPAANYGLLVLTSANGYVLALDSYTGIPRWKISLSDEISAPALITRHAIFVKTIDGKVFALHPQDGHTLWHYSHGAPTLILRTSSALQVAPGAIVVGFADGKLALLEEMTGKLIWQRSLALPDGNTPMAQMVDIAATPYVAGHTIYAASYHGNITAMNVYPGDILWQNALSTYNNVAVNETTLYASDESGVIWAINRYNGRLRWKQTALSGQTLTAPVLNTHGLVLGDSRGNVHVLSTQDGRLLGRLSVSKSALLSQPLVATDTVYFLDVKGALTAVTVGWSKRSVSTSKALKHNGG